MQGAAINRKTLRNFKSISFLNETKVYPFELIIGFSNQTERGITPNNIKLDVNDYASFKRVFTGLNTIIATWKNSTSYKINGNKMQRQFQVGSHFKAKVLTSEHSSSFASSGIDATFLNQYDDQTISLITNKEITESDVFNFFIIPKLKAEKWLYITSATNYYNQSQNFVYSQITLTGVANKIETSGLAVEQYIHRSPRAGAGYAWPVENSDGSVILDNIKDKDIGVTSVQLELEGLAAFSSISCFGSPVGNKVNATSEILAPRLLLPYRLETPEPSPLNTKPTYESEYYFGEEMYAELQTRYDDWKKIYFVNENYLSAQEQNAYDGVLETKKDITATNLTNSAGKFKNIFHNNTWQIKMTKSYDTEPNEMSPPLLNLANQTLKVAEIMFFNHFINSKYQSLPLTKKHNVMWSLNSLPVIGGFLSRVLMGATVGWKYTNITIANDGMNWFLPCSVIDYMNKRFKRTSPTTIDLNLFKKGDNLTDAATYTGINSIGSLIKVGLTDLFTIKLKNQTYTFNTVYLGQKTPAKDENNKAVDVSLVNTQLFINETARPVPPKHSFLIDTIQDYTLGQTNVRYSLYANDFSIWQGTYKTKSNFTGNIRDIANIKKLGDIKVYDNRTINFPAAIVAPTPTGIKFPIVSLDSFAKAFYFDYPSFDFDNLKNGSDKKQFIKRTSKYQVQQYPYTPSLNFWSCENVLNPLDAYFETETVISSVNINQFSGSLAQFKLDYKFIEVDGRRYWINDLDNKRITIRDSFRYNDDFKVRYSTAFADSKKLKTFATMNFYLTISDNKIKLIRKISVLMEGQYKTLFKRPVTRIINFVPNTACSLRIAYEPDVNDWFVLFQKVLLIPK